jgi:membrane protease subunit (stomatin/prohibitin family)
MSSAMNNANNAGGGGGGGAPRGALVPKPASGFKWVIKYARVSRDNAPRIAELVAQGYQPAPEAGPRTRLAVKSNTVTYFKATQVLKKIAQPKVKKVIIDEKQMFSMADLASALEDDANNAAGAPAGAAAAPAGAAAAGAGGGPVAGWGGEQQGEIVVQSNSQELASAFAGMGMGGNNSNGMSRSRKTRKARKSRKMTRKYRR